ncbi:hypothetical protein MBLNU13_g08621t1 [Cladosporium sp. NU13]
MSFSIPIPTSRNKQPAHAHARNGTTSASSYSYHATPGSSYASSAAYSPSSFNASPASLGKGKGKGKEREVVQPRRASLLDPEFWYADPSLCATGSSLSKSEHTVVDLGHSGTPRLVSCVKRGQGFDWNQELFLPSYVDYDSQDLERRQDPVEDIVLTEEEIAAMFPQ